MTTVLNQSLLDEYMAKFMTKKGIQGAVICIEEGRGSLSLVSSTGNMKGNDHYFIASVTKLYVTAIILKLRAENKLQLDNKISEYVSEDLLSGIHRLNGVDYSNEITIKHLMSNTSGIPDYFSSGIFAELIDGKDQAWPLEKTLSVIKQMKPKFKPGQKGKAQYCDTNYQLLGNVIETITEKPIQAVFKEHIFDELNLENTYVYEDIKDTRPHPLYYKAKALQIPIYLSSIAPEGGIVSTARETMIFLKAFFNGHFFPKEELIELMDWNLLFGPGLFFYGTGISMHPISIRGIKKGLIGHWGQSGAFAFYHPQTDLYFTGTVNQLIGHSQAVRVMMKLIHIMK